MPLATLSAMEIERGRTVIYVNSFGRHYDAVPVSLSQRPAAPAAISASNSTTGGTLGTSVAVSYRRTVIIGGVESLPSTQAGTTTDGVSTTNSVTVTLPAVAGAQAQRIYGRTAGTQAFMVEVAGDAPSWVDTGAITPSGTTAASIVQYAAGLATLRVSTIGGDLYSPRQLIAVPAATADGQTGVYYYRRG